MDWFFEAPNEVIYLIIEYLDIRHTMRFVSTCKDLWSVYKHDQKLISDIKQKELVDPSYGSLTDLLSSDMDASKIIASIGRVKITRKDFKYFAPPPIHRYDSSSYHNHNRVHDNDNICIIS